MSKPMIAAVGLLGLMGLSLPAIAASDADCEKSFQAADTNSDGVLTAAEGRSLFRSDARSE